jgi:hypothetical protein
MRPSEMEHPGQSGRTLKTGAGEVYREPNSCPDDNSFSPENQIDFSKSLWVGVSV